MQKLLGLVILSLGLNLLSAADGAFDKNKSAIESWKAKSEKLQKELEEVNGKWEVELMGQVRLAKKKSLESAQLQNLMEQIAAFLPQATDNSVGGELIDLKAKYGKNFEVALERMDSVAAAFLSDAMDRAAKAAD